MSHATLLILKVASSKQGRKFIGGIIALILGLRKSPTACAICGSVSNLNYETEGKLICSSCFEKLKEVSPHE